MALSGLQIQKLLPKTNCKECGSNTCLAFAMKLAAKTASLSECPYASDEAKEILGAASEPPVKSTAIGVTTPSKLGEEIVMYRHEKTFYNQTVIAINIDDTAADYQETIDKINDYKLERVGEILTIGAIGLTQKQDDAGKFGECAKLIFEATKLPLVINAKTPAAAKAAAEAVKGEKCIICNATKDNVAEMLPIAKDNEHNLAITSDNLDDIVAVTAKLKEDGFNDLMLQFQCETLAQSLQINTIARRAAIKNNYKPLGYPSVKFIDSGDYYKDTVIAVNEIDKYGGIVVLPAFDAAQLVSLMTLRLNIFTDPQKPIQVEPKLYAIGEPDRNSPVFLTTNFSLTYFLVSGEIENSGISAWLLIPECEGFSVLTAWSAGKFSGQIIGKFAKEVGLDDQVDTRSITIPGWVSQISGEVEEAMPGWKVLVGPQEASDIESYVKAVLLKK